MAQHYKLGALLEDDTGRHQFQLEISDPIAGETGEDYYCIVHAPSLFAVDKRIYGINKEQAVSLARDFTRQMLSGKKLFDETVRPIEL